MNGIMYCRVSTKEQLEGTSLETQELACREHARAHKINIERTFIEKGESAKFADRTQLIELIEFCRKNKGTIQVLLVWKVDRFARNAADHFSIKAALLKLGVRVVSVTEPIDNNPEGQLMETMLAGFAQFDNDLRATRTVTGMKRKLEEGIWPWQQPLGYESPLTGDEKKNAPDRPSEPQFSLIRKALKEFATGAYTKADLLRLMTGWGITTKKGRMLSEQSLDQLLRNPYYAGILRNPWTGEEHEGAHMAMISKTEFAQIQQIFRRRDCAVPHRKFRPEFPLRGLVRCGGCLRYLTSSFSKGRSQRYAYYHCNNRTCVLRSKSCPVQIVHDEFNTFLSTVAPKPESVAMLKEVVKDIAGEENTIVKTRQESVQKEIVGLNRQIRELIGMKAQDLITSEEFVENKSALSSRRMLLESSLAPTDISAGEINMKLDDIERPITELPITWNALTDPYRRRFEHCVVPVGFVNEKSRTAELGPLFRIFGESANDKTTLVRLVRKSWNQILTGIDALWCVTQEYQQAAGPSKDIGSIVINQSDDDADNRTSLDI